MSRGNWNTIKQSKMFYIKTYRWALTSLTISLLINGLLFLSIVYYYLNQPKRDFYATSGILPPIKLTPLNTPNYTNKALLAPDPMNNEAIKNAPQ